ncbi:unnamed protein product [Rotaria sp. Silwood2]|nr:unnamed protein product [Rotaria sp. Silwood2]CAF2905224.1 unnamed protein product [Rotaria sp. Silwood2]CAF3059056.1 unnamed protein product [Rotaria sp. Silwood2]CAF3906785.1 unnamed protein product [Rotaria sp. Silwood2]CAF4060694.1 unnamed protein product [Rotaria sp. Silwood2]
MVTISFIILAIFFTFVSSNNEHNIVRITDSGSTNTAGYVIELRRDGLVKWTVAPRIHPTLSTTPSTTTAQNSIQLSLFATNSIFQAVEEAFPFNQYAPIFCIKSVSFGTTLHVTYNGQETPDLNCPQHDQRLIVLSKYIDELIKDLHINTFG